MKDAFEAKQSRKCKQLLWILLCSNNWYFILNSPMHLLHLRLKLTTRMTSQLTVWYMFFFLIQTLMVDILLSKSPLCSSDSRNEWSYLILTRFWCMVWWGIYIYIYETTLLLLCCFFGPKFKPCKLCLLYIYATLWFLTSVT